jgi:tetratricopeptide (TPR) repeat protein
VQVAKEESPDFRWPGRTCGDIALRLDRYTDRFFNRLREARHKRPFVGILYLALAGLLAIYALSVLVAVCYVQFPVSPFTFWDLARWSLIPIFSIAGAVGLFFALIHLSIFLLFLVYTCGYFILSLAYLPWSIWKAYLAGSLWLKRYRRVLPGGLLTATILAIFIDGSYRFWDKRFVPAVFIGTLLICLSAWASLFCVIVRDKALQPDTPGKILKWTLLLAVPIALFVYWHAGSMSVEYFLRKNVVRRPDDRKAWLDLAWHYADKADTYASYEGDAEYTPPDPAPYYEKALECFNRAVELGDGGFQTHLARAQIADNLGKKAEAIAYGEIALNIAPLDERQEIRDQIKALREMLARNSDSATSQKEDEEKKARIRRERLETLPPIIRWGVSIFI